VTEASEVVVLATGGTIDKVYGIGGELEIGPPAAAAILAAAGVHFSVESVLRKDSLELNDDDRAAIVEHVRRQTTRSIVITHGTDTMTDTAIALQTSGVGDGRTIVLTGAMRPASMLDSDASFNLGAALVATRALTSGVYIVMHGTVFAAGRVIKDRSAGQFIEIQR
jgi:L-asparaginase